MITREREQERRSLWARLARAFSAALIAGVVILHASDSEARDWARVRNPEVARGETYRVIEAWAQGTMRGKDIRTKNLEHEDVVMVHLDYIRLGWRNKLHFEKFLGQHIERLRELMLANPAA